MSKIFITGDTHGINDAGKLVTCSVKNNLTYDDYIIVCGDCGVLWNKKLTKEFVDFYKSLHTNILFVDGNHENYDMLNALPVTEWNGGKVHKVSEHIIHLMRGQIFILDGKKFLCLGGADSHDKLSRIEHLSWWKQERITSTDIAEAKRNLSRYENAVDYVITHTPPYDFQNKIITELTQCGEDIPFYLRDKLAHTSSADRLEEISSLVKYTAWFSGHLHMDTKIGNYYSLYNRIVKI